ncbi:hypothetical protein S58_14180 [Bradyrhizobium oligotrophicum S58]|uniref:Uncharacterized protein n=1 Tax=Bradyrhizobium oligotrophicum S58 TaxID=1245469 RepID=M4Z3I9_9BRAD|nr:hypothetical protein S58_14180 [Bradyrhizobium oligotrophicum S58]
MAGYDGRDVLDRRTFMDGTAGALALPLLPDRTLARNAYAFKHGAFDTGCIHRRDQLWWRAVTIASCGYSKRR